MKEQGIAIKVDGTAVTVRIGMSEGCSSCNSRDGCAVAGKELEAESAAGAGINVGDAVELEVPDSARAAGAFWLLVVPLGLFFGAYIGIGVALPASGEGVQAIAGIVGLAAGLAFAATVAIRGRMSSRPQVTRIVVD